MKMKAMALPLLAVALGLAQPASAAPAYGSLDSTFGTKGLATYSGIQGPVVHAAIAADGRIYTLSDTSSSIAPSFVVGRLLADGTVDPAFGTNGFITLALPPEGARLSEIAVDDINSRIYTVGDFGPNGVNGTGLLRSTFDGKMDAGFKGGVVLISTAPLQATGAGFVRVLLQPDGNIVVGGQALNLKTSSGVSDAFLLARLGPDGTIDTAFGNQGTSGLSVFKVPQSSTHLNSIETIQGHDGNIYSMGSGPTSSSQVGAILIRASGTGEPDISFGANGMVTLSFSDEFTEFKLAAVKNDGTVVAQAVYTGALDHYALAEYSSAGIPLASFGTNGVEQVGNINNGIETFGYVNDAEGRILVLGCVPVTNAPSSDDCGAGAIIRVAGSPDMANGAEPGNSSSSSSSGSSSSSSSSSGGSSSGSGSSSSGGQNAGGSGGGGAIGFGSALFFCGAIAARRRRRGAS